MKSLVCLSMVLAACGSDSTKKTDAPMQASQTVNQVNCPATPDATVTTTDATFSYSPNAVTINQNGIVKFTMSAIHDVVPNSTGSDPGLNVGFNTTACLQFTAKGTFGFHCGPHGFTGTITVN